MKDIGKIKRNVAREFLLLLSLLLLIGLTWLCLSGHNYYYERKEISLKKDNNELSEKIDSLPVDRISALYDGLNSDFVLYYVVEEDEYTIPVGEKIEFLRKFPSAKIQTSNIRGYSCYQSDKKFDEFGIPYSLCDFDFVDLAGFKSY